GETTGDQMPYCQGRKRYASVRPVLASQTATVWPSVEVRRLPSGEKATDRTVPPCRNRTVPRRATAPGGSGSPWASVSGGAACKDARPAEHPRIARNRFAYMDNLHGQRWRSAPQPPACV